MPKRTDIKDILIIGAGPIIIGQACEFDYSGAQACKALKEEGYRVILVNSNPATIMTDPDMADATYIEPVHWQTVEKIIEKERPDAILPTMGGQTGLNCALDLARLGVLDKYSVELIGASRDAIDTAEDREKFKGAMEKIGLDMPHSRLAHDMDEAKDALNEIGYPVIIRPSFTLGGTGGGIAYNKEEFLDIAERGLDASPTNEVLLEQSVIGWKEFEMEVVRDSKDNCIIICSIENLDPMGMHTGDSITVAPAQTLTDKEYQIMRNASIAVLREIGVDTGGSNVQFAVNPDNGKLVVIEMNPRVSRSSALASKATGFPIAKVAAKLAVGYTLDELKNEITGGKTPASFEPTIDYVVTKIPRFTFEKFPKAEDRITTQMKSVGEVMAIGRTFQESLQKALRGLETGIDGLSEIIQTTQEDIVDTIMTMMSVPRSDRLLYIGEAFRHGVDFEDVFSLTHIDPWFLAQIQDIIHEETRLKKLEPGSLTEQHLRNLKQKGFADSRIAKLMNTTEEKIRNQRYKFGIRPVFKRVDSCAAEFAATTAYMYSSYEDECEAKPSDRKKIIILGGGPNRIGQGIEFDYCCVQAALAMREAGYESIMVNCNPETVSTDYDTSDRLYFEPLTLEDVLEIISIEKPEGVIVQFGGQTPLKLARQLEAAGAPIIGTTPDCIDLAEDRERFQQFLEELGLRQPPNRTARTVEQAVNLAQEITYPLVVRPSYVLGGRAMEIVYSEEDLRNYMAVAVSVSNESPVLLDKFLDDAIEVDVDAVSDGDQVIIGGIMEHIEQAGIHSGDSACSLPPYSLDKSIISKIEDQVRKMARGLCVNGLMNTQFAIKGDQIYVLEVNPRASRTVPFVSKATNVPLARVAAKCMVGISLQSQNVYDTVVPSYFSVKEAVFPFIKFPDVDPLLGPEMKSTGEVMGIGENFGEAYAKAQLGAGEIIPKEGLAFISVRDADKIKAQGIAAELFQLGFRICATHGTASVIREAGIECQGVNKVREGQPHIVDMLKNDEIVLIVNTTEGKKAVADSYSIRRTALQHKVFYTTTIAGASASIQALKLLDNSKVNCLQELHKGVFL
jgi:carbamoyl-phosphate synthase large subunit